jgi:hypothetical protein
MLNEEFKQHLVGSIALMHKNLALPVPYERTTHAEIRFLIGEIERLKAMKPGFNRLVRSMTLDKDTQAKLSECRTLVSITISRLERHVIRSLNQLENRQ